MYLPYNPIEKVLVAKIYQFDGDVEIKSGTNTITTEDEIKKHIIIPKDEITVQT
jgi:hypothetical protein